MEVHHSKFQSVSPNHVVSARAILHPNVRLSKPRLCCDKFILCSAIEELYTLCEFESDEALVFRAVEQLDAAKSDFVQLRERLVRTSVADPSEGGRLTPRSSPGKATNEQSSSPASPQGRRSVAWEVRRSPARARSSAQHAAKLERLLRSDHSGTHPGSPSERLLGSSGTSLAGSVDDELPCRNRKG